VDFSRNEDEIKRLIAEYLKTARERLQSAKLLFEAGQWRDSVSRSYYVFLDAADALLLTKDLRPKSHAGTINLLGAHFIKTGIVDKKYAKWFNTIMQARLDADYERARKFSEKEAQSALNEVKGFLEMVESLWPEVLGSKG
jgi:uncharacterized protein (UPF0332 family)